MNTVKGKYMKRGFIAADQSGGILVLVAVLFVVLLGVAAFAIDIGHLMVVKNEVQNAADAGALAGARMLYTSITGTAITINAGANAIAYSAATANTSDSSSVEVPLVERGHWCFSCIGPDGKPGVFTPNSDLTSYTLTGPLSFAAIDSDTSLVNAVRVVASRGPALPAASYFASIFGFSGFSLSADAVAWVGFSGTNIHVDQPIAICQESVQDPGGNFICSCGRMINSSGSGYASESGAWTNLQQGDNACNGASPASVVKPLVTEGCTDGQISGITLSSGQEMTTVNGQMESVFSALYNCWQSQTPNQPWKITLPMIECGSSPPGPCNTLVGAITVEILWITNQNDPQFKNVPTTYTDPESGITYSCAATDQTGREQCWADFLNKFNVVDENGKQFTVDTAASAYLGKNIFFKPSCSVTSMGGSGGAPSNVWAQTPLLVQ